MFHDSFNFPIVLDSERLAERTRLMRANPAISRKVAELDSGRRPTILPRLAAPVGNSAGQSADARPSETKAVPTFRQFQTTRVTELLTTKRCLYPGDATDIHNFLPGLVELLLSAKPRSVIEIGSDRGVSTELFLLTTARVVAIDPWQNESSFREFAERCAGYPHLEIVRERCPEALEKIRR